MQPLFRVICLLTVLPVYARLCDNPLQTAITVKISQHRTVFQGGNIIEPLRFIPYYRIDIIAPGITDQGAVIPCAAVLIQDPGNTFTVQIQILPRLLRIEFAHLRLRPLHRLRKIKGLPAEGQRRQRQHFAVILKRHLPAAVSVVTTWVS